MSFLTDASLSILAIFKNEGDIIREWVQHYFSQGATQILLIDNNSTDDWQGALAELGHDSRLTCLEDARIHAQLDIYRDILHSGLIKADWLLPCDLDEFIYARKPFSRISQYLSTLPDDVSGVALPWKLFGSSGHIQHPRGRTVDSFVMRRKASGGVLGKTISRTQRIQGIEVHRHHYNEGSLIRSCGTTVDLNPFLHHDEASMQREKLHLNHYSVRSREFFEKVKMKRGSVISSDNTYLQNYFFSRDQNDIRDDELSQLTSGDPQAATEPSWFDPRRHPLPPGPRPPVFRLLSRTEGLELPADQRPLRPSWQVQTAAQGRSKPSRWLDGGTLPADREEVISALVRLASLAVMPLDRRLPVRIDAGQGRKSCLRRAQRWFELLQINHPVRWMTAAGISLGSAENRPAEERWSPDPSIQQEVEAWRCAALAIARNRPLQTDLQRRQGREGLAIALPPRKAGRGRAGRFEQQLRPVLKALAREQRIPLLRLRSMPLEEQILQLRRYRWIVGPFQPSMLLVHALGEVPHHAATLILLSRGSRRSRQVMQRMQRVHRVPHRLLVLPAVPGSGIAPAADRRMIGDLIRWLRTDPAPQSGALMRG